MAYDSEDEDAPPQLVEISRDETAPVPLEETESTSRVPITIVTGN